MSILKFSTTTITALFVTTSLLAISACTMAPEPEKTASNPTVTADVLETKPFPRVEQDGFAQSAPPAEMAAMDMQMAPLRGLVANVRNANKIAQPSQQGFFGDMPQQGYTVTGDKYAPIERSVIKSAESDPVSTFSVDVDTGAYSLVRDRLNGGMLPHPDAVRLEEMINYFTYSYPQPEGDVPFSVTTDAMQTPWNKGTHLVRIGLQGKSVPVAERPKANLVFLVDVSGSMRDPDKLPLLVKSLQYMAGSLTAEDRISLVVYAGASGLVLEPTSGSETQTIRDALGRLQAGGSTAGGAGIKLAYDTARKAFIDGGLNRIILATDGDFNVGIHDVSQLKTIIEEERKSGVSLTTLGFGDGNFNDALMEQLADAGNGNYAYVDNFSEAKKVLGTQLNATLMTIAKDVKIQVEFNPAVVAEYRLLGYENRVLAREDFDNDKVDAGEIGAGHSVTALYEVALVGSEGRRFGDLRYDAQKPVGANARKDELAYVKLRYKEPGGEVSKLIDQVIPTSQLHVRKAPSPDLVHASAVAAYGQMLAHDKYLGDFGPSDVLALAQSLRAEGPYRQEFKALVENATALIAMQGQAGPGR
ncbi:vWA domain-containing protein [Kordiimonas lacus]|uniref:Ca-activated chloride channel family protein n=1 Tax=Kordiimonas lacus TaxID=637679 RepID=A0A1G7EZT8_9PROT|nr:VWA domain-containing protein [Kordiimonas lacus]SDE68815.1 Ca-activated chloride channel family protein [Kordiimonas lacus]